MLHHVAGVWVTGNAFVDRQTQLVEAFADEMTYHIGDDREMELCVKEYKGKLGPKLYREAMFKVTRDGLIWVQRGWLLRV